MKLSQVWLGSMKSVKNEVENIRWIKWNDFLTEIKTKPGFYSVWSEQEAKLLSENKEFNKLYGKFVK